MWIGTAQGISNYQCGVREGNKLPGSNNIPVHILYAGFVCILEQAFNNTLYSLLIDQISVI